MTYCWRKSWISLGFGSSSNLRSDDSDSSSSMISLQRSMHSSQIYTPGPAMSFLTCFCDLPQNEHFSRSPPSPMRATYDPLPLGHRAVAQPVHFVTVHRPPCSVTPIRRGSPSSPGRPHGARVPSPRGGTLSDRRATTRSGVPHRAQLAADDDVVHQAVVLRLRRG